MIVRVLASFCNEDCEQQFFTQKEATCPQKDVANAKKALSISRPVKTDG